MSSSAVLDDLEYQYNPRKAVPNVDEFARRAADLSRATRERLPAQLDVRYGEGPLATLDVFHAAEAQGKAPLHVFLHGGYWRGRDKSDYSYVADALVPLGITTVVMNYDLCPTIELPAIVQQVRAGLQWIHAHAGELGGDPDAFTASGHSAGAHLIAAALPRPGESVPPWVPAFAQANALEWNGLQVRWMVLMALAVVLAAHLVLSRLRVGRRFYAVGSNPVRCGRSRPPDAR